MKPRNVAAPGQVTDVELARPGLGLRGLGGIALVGEGAIGGGQGGGVDDGLAVDDGQEAVAAAGGEGEEGEGGAWGEGGMEEEEGGGGGGEGRAEEGGGRWCHGHGHGLAGNSEWIGRGFWRGIDATDPTRGPLINGPGQLTQRRAGPIKFLTGLTPSGPGPICLTKAWSNLNSKLTVTS